MLIFTAPAFSHSIFQKQEEIQPDKTAPFFINIYANGNDVKSDFEEETVNYTPQIHFFNKKFTDNQPSENENFFISARRTTSVSQNKKASDTIEFMTNYNFGKWDLKSSLSQEAVSGINQYSNYFSFEPSYKLNENFSLFGGMSHSITDNYDQTKLGVKWTPIKFNRFEFKVSVSNYTKQFYNYRNKLNFETVFKI